MWALVSHACVAKGNKYASTLVLSHDARLHNNGWLFQYVRMQFVHRRQLGRYCSFCADECAGQAQ